MATKSTEATIDYLLACLDATEGKTNWEQVAQNTGFYKSGKFAIQAFRTIEKKYKGTVIVNATATTAQAPTPKKEAKRVAKTLLKRLMEEEEEAEEEEEDDDDDDDDDEGGAGKVNDKKKVKVDAAATPTKVKQEG
ncbi:uncharacterized protein HMPREF1541_04627 [Cyphellophora europaea CBS 101466]|uniref:Uncharacterized protein n=1 Tax=Cyphellophora europaea (strain CBS 101466) TaxID=1220924 RepID=W2RVL2_CYPE1|nr:uncharacterized protein HMPREF1541_04627 [Cyphellophora europaea CBS 101466]ETN40350.1 hypothetical protein HMPREF1541_04627 [Cyphellophora europaea CBS 101466]